MSPKYDTFLNLSNSITSKRVLVDVADCYPICVGFDSLVMYGFLPHANEVEDTVLTNQPCKRSKHAF
jgi:hypothetical protein